MVVKLAAVVAVGVAGKTEPREPSRTTRGRLAAADPPAPPLLSGNHLRLRGGGGGIHKGRGGLFTPALPYG